ncbi:hypothetical protein P9E34_04145 [Schinkia azotoformans]|uniref:hypothetical protein n=1 Tax=Schinkia azotoformans TaxID=1454 RepID=UPI002DB6DEC2|nr:hypothetical protein [Schinkia azotoformans]MEC1723937.1 hypothetical protein [Schinkia azotoformans]
MKKNHLRRNKYNIIISVIFFLICWFLYYKGYINTEEKNVEFHQNLLTVNTIFLGFLFTALGIMVGFADKKLIKALDVAGYMDNYYNSIYFGMFYHGISTVISTVAVVLGNVVLINELILIQQITLLGGVLFFIKSILGILKIIREIRKEFYK